MRALAVLPFALLAACSVTEDKANNQSTVTISGDAAKNGTASALNGISNTVDRAAGKIDAVSNNAGEIHGGLANLTASADKLGKSVEHAADSLGDAVDGKKHVEVTTEKTTTTTTEKK